MWYYLASMKISVFGATGRTGRMVVEQALSQGIEVVGLVRDVGKMTMDDPKLQIVQDDGVWVWEGADGGAV